MSGSIATAANVGGDEIVSGKIVASDGNLANGDVRFGLRLDHNEARACAFHEGTIVPHHSMTRVDVSRATEGTLLATGEMPDAASQPQHSFVQDLDRKSVV